MTQIDFYILAATNLQARLAFVARLADKIMAARHQLCIATQSVEQGEALSEILWQVKPESFIAHSLVIDAGKYHDPVLISPEQPPAFCHDVLINLTDGLLENSFSRFNRVLEIVVQTPEVLSQTREAFQFYKSRSYPIRTHNLNDAH